MNQSLLNFCLTHTDGPSEDVPQRPLSPNSVAFLNAALESIEDPPKAMKRLFLSLESVTESGKGADALAELCDYVENLDCAEVVRPLKGWETLLSFVDKKHVSTEEMALVYDFLAKSSQNHEKMSKECFDTELFQKIGCLIIEKKGQGEYPNVNFSDLNLVKKALSALSSLSRSNASVMENLFSGKGNECLNRITEIIVLINNIDKNENVNENKNADLDDEEIREKKNQVITKAIHLLRHIANASKPLSGEIFTEMSEISGSFSKSENENVQEAAIALLQAITN